jgi:fructokinase
VLLDCFGAECVPGGAAANLAFHAAQLGANARLVSAVGNDDDGDRLLAHLAASGVDVSLVQRHPGEPTGRVVVDLTAGEPRYTILPAAWDHIRPLPCPPCDALVFSPLSARGAASRAALLAVLDDAPPATLRVLDLNLRPPHTPWSNVEPLLARAALLKLSDTELDLLAEHRGLAGLARPEAASELARLGPWRRVLVTRGAEGAWLLDEAGNSETIPPAPARFVDPVGAGDAFLATFCVHLLRGAPPCAAAEHASRIAAWVVSQRGAMPSHPPGPPP